MIKLAKCHFCPVNYCHRGTKRHLAYSVVIVPTLETKADIFEHSKIKLEAQLAAISTL